MTFLVHQLDLKRFQESFEMNTTLVEYSLATNNFFCFFFFFFQNSHSKINTVPPSVRSESKIQTHNRIPGFA